MANDNINTAYLGTPASGNTTSNATTVFSDISLSGGTLYGNVEGLILGEVAGTSDASGADATYETVTVGGGTAVTGISSATFAVVAITAPVNASTTTTVTWSGATIVNDETNPDTYLVAAKSAFSADVVVDAYASDKDTVTIRYSNVSGTAAVFAAQTMRITRIEF